MWYYSCVVSVTMARPMQLSTFKRREKELMQLPLMEYVDRLGDLARTYRHGQAKDYAQRRLREVRAEITAFKRREKELMQLPPREYVEQFEALVRTYQEGVVKNYTQQRMQELRADYASGKLDILYYVNQELEELSDGDYSDSQKIIGVFVVVAMDIVPAIFIGIDLGFMMMPDGRHSVLEVMVRALDMVHVQDPRAAIYVGIVEMIVYFHRAAPRDLKLRLREHLPLEDAARASGNFENRVGPFTRHVTITLDGVLMLYNPDTDMWDQDVFQNPYED